MTSAPSKPDLVLMTTTDVGAGRQMEVARLIASIDAFRHARPSISLVVRFLVQRCETVEAARAMFAVPDWVELSVSPVLLPSSNARNVLIAGAHAAGELTDDAMVAFPDDDCWYPAGTLEHIVDQFRARPALDLWLCRYGMDGRWDATAREVVPNFQQLLSYTAANTTILRGRVLQRIGGYDEDLGIGTPARNGEDTDFGVRAALASRELGFVDARLIGHRDFNRTLRRRYYAGSLVVIARYLGAAPGSRIAFARKLAVGLMLLGRGELKPGDLIEAARLLKADRARRRQGIARGIAPLVAAA